MCIIKVFPRLRSRFKVVGTNRPLGAKALRSKCKFFEFSNALWS